MEDREFLEDYGKVKELLFLELMPYDEEVDLTYPVMRVGDMMLVCRVLMEYDLNEDRIRAVVIDNELFEKYVITKEKLFEDAAASMEKMFTVSYMPIGKRNMMVTTDFGFKGAAIVFCKGVQKKLLKKLRKGFYLTFGSPHGVLVSSPDTSKEFLQSMVKLFYEKEDRLSGKLYRFNADEMKIEEVE